jgi:hypothetical protein
MNWRSSATRGCSLLLVAALAAACASSPPATGTPQPATTAPSVATPAPNVATPVPTTSPTQPPSPTPPADVSAGFTAHVADPQFQGSGPVSGTISIATFDGTLTGAMAVKGADSAFDLAIDIPSVMSASSSSIKVDGKAYQSQNGAPWFEVKSASTGGGLNAAIDTAASTVTDEGVVTKNGQQLHHMVPAGGGAITGAEMGFASDPAMAAAPGSLEFYARDDGSLAIMTVTLAWTVNSGATPLDARMAIDFTFDENPDVSIAPPDNLWTRFASAKHAYTIGYPAGWTVIRAKTKDDADVFALSATQLSTAMREVQPKALSGNLKAYVKAFVRSTPQKLDVNEATTVGGKDAWRLAYYGKVNGQDLYFVFTLLMQGRNGYAVAFVGPKGYESDIVAFHEMQLSTLVLPGG